MRARCLSFVPFLFASCGLVREWRELQTAPMTIGECFDGINFVATGAGFASDGSVTDRGLGTWQSRWRFRVLRPSGRPARYRVHAEILVDEGSAAKGWPIRFAVDQEKVEDLRRSMDPREEDWSPDGQDKETEATLGEALVRRLAPKPMPKRDAAKLP
jgi:hypothetical protein